MEYRHLPHDMWREHQNTHFAVVDTLEGPKMMKFSLIVNADIVCYKCLLDLQQGAILFENPETPLEEMTKLRSFC